MNQLSSKNKTIVVFSDVHQDYRRVMKILEKEKPDHAVSLGDWFDSHVQDAPLDTTGTARLIKQLVFQPNFTTLLGNHDVSYFYYGLNQNAYCSGYTEEKDGILDDVWSSDRQNIIDKFKWYIFIDNYLCTHAGLSPLHLPPHQKTSKKALSNWLDEEIKKTKIALASGQPHWIFEAGRARGGYAKTGGLTWLDEDEIKRIPNLKQISGHNPGSCIRPHPYVKTPFIDKWNHILIDCFLKEYLVINNGKITIKKYADL